MGRLATRRRKKSSSSIDTRKPASNQSTQNESQTRTQSDCGPLPDAGVTINPCTDAAERANRAWAARFLINDEETARRLALIRSARLAGFSYQGAALDPVSLASDLIAWLFVFDDYHGELNLRANPVEAAALFDDFERVLRGGALPPQAIGLHRGLADLSQRIAARAGRAWLDHFCIGMREYFDGCLLEYPYRRIAHPPTLTVYRLLRKMSIGTIPVLDMIELSLKQVLNAEMHAKPLLNDLRNRTALMCAWVNDLYSYKKETSDHDPINLVTVLREQRKLTVDDAQAAAVKLFYEDLASFRALRAEFDRARDTSELERRYTQGLEDWVFGNMAWSQNTLRYKNPSTALLTDIAGVIKSSNARFDDPH